MLCEMAYVVWLLGRELAFLCCAHSYGMNNHVRVRGSYRALGSADNESAVIWTVRCDELWRVGL